VTWTRLCGAAELPEGEARVFEAEGREFAAARTRSSVLVVENRCSHDDGPLGEGRLLESADGAPPQIECPRHGARFDLATGRATRMPAVSPIEAFRARVEGGDVLVDLPEDL
jgi:3-phenylpropionate/trans-cinnamate dioxygenase ferredoxin subunit